MMPPTKVIPYADKKINKLITLLNTIDKVCVYDTSMDYETNFIEIYIRHNEPTQNSLEVLAQFANRLSQVISANKDFWEGIINLAWLGNRNNPVVILEIPLEEIDHVIRILAVADSVCS
jgi:hypothetical protein